MRMCFSTHTVRNNRNTIASDIDIVQRRRQKPFKGHSFQRPPNMFKPLFFFVFSLFYPKKPPIFLDLLDRNLSLQRAGDPRRRPSRPSVASSWILFVPTVSSRSRLRGILKSCFFNPNVFFFFLTRKTYCLFCL